MKKTVKMIGMACLVGAFAFAGSSCKKNNNNNTSINVNMPRVEVSSVDGDRAYIDYFDGNIMKWSEDDQVMFYNLNSDYTKSVRNIYTIYDGVGTTGGYFNGGNMGAAQNVGYYAFYPASMVVNHNIGSGNSQTFEVPASQNYNVNSMDPTSLVMAVKGFAPTEDFNLKHIFGFVNLRLKGTKCVDKIIITDNAFNLNGNITLDIPSITSTTAGTLETICDGLADYNVDYEMVWAQFNQMLTDMNYTSEPGDKTMTLDCSGVYGVDLYPDNYTNFIFTLRPGALHQGFRVKVEYTDGSSDIFDKYNYGTQAYEDVFGSEQSDFPRGFCVKPGYLMNYNVN